MAASLLKFHSDLIKQIGLGINIARTYPKGHPSMQPVVQRLRILLREIPIEQQSISLVVIEDIIMIGEERYDAKRLPIVRSLVNRFNQLDVKSITFNVEVSESDVLEFFDAMAASPADITDYGDIVSLIRAKGIIGIAINKFRVGVVMSDHDITATSWGNFLDSLTPSDQVVTDKDRLKELSSFLAGVGLVGNEPVTVQTDKIVSGLERLALMVADQYGEDRWDEYSMVFSRMLQALSPSIRKNIVKFRTENKKLATLFKNLIPSMTDEDLIDVITTKAKEKSPTTENDVIEILKNVTGSRLPGILSSLRVNVPELDFEKIVGRLMHEMKTVKGEKAADKFLSKNLESEMRTLFPRLRHESHEERIKAIDELMEYSGKIFESGKIDLIRLLIDRLDTMADAESDVRTFSKIVESLKAIYLRSRDEKQDDILQFVSKKFGKHLLRKDVSLRDKKRIVIKSIADLKDENYVTELVSLLWDQGTFAEAREALVALSEYSVPLLIETLKETDDKAVRMKIIDVLVRIGQPTVREIKKLLKAEEWFVRRNGVFLLGEIKAESAIDDIGVLIDDEKEQVQLEVIQSLCKIDHAKGKDFLLKALNSEYKSTVLSAINVLDKQDVVQKLPEVAEWLKLRKGIPDEKEEKFRREIIHVLGSYGDDTVIPYLAGILHEKALFKGNVLYATKEAALHAIARIGTEAAMHVLQETRNEKDQFVASVAEEILNKQQSSQ